MLKKANKDHSAKLAAVSAVLEQLSPGTLKASDDAALRKFLTLALRWAELAAAELERRGEGN
jgi:hypothetical protein